MCPKNREKFWCLFCWISPKKLIFPPLPPLGILKNIHPWITLLWSPHRHWDETSSGITKCSLQLSQLWKDTKQSDANSIETVHELHHFLRVPTTQAPTVTKYNAFIRESENTFMDTKDTITHVKHLILHPIFLSCHKMVIVIRACSHVYYPGPTELWLIMMHAWWR